MSDRKWRTWEVLGLIFVLAAGNLLHFVYDWSGQSPVVGALAAVNESTWEHMKLLTTPWVLWRIVGRDIMWLDVAIFQTAVLLGFWVTWAMLRRRALASPVWQVAGAAVLAAVWAAFILWTFAPPDLPLFADPETGLRGIR